MPAESVLDWWAVTCSAQPEDGLVDLLLGGLQHELAHRALGFALLVLVETIDEQHTIQMVELVLVEARQQFVGLDADLVAIEVQATEVHHLGSHDVPGEAGHRQAPFFEDPLPFCFLDDRIHDGVRTGFVAQVVDKNALLHTDLCRSQSEAGRGVHGVDHLIGKAHQSGVDVVDLPSTLAQHRVAHDADPLNIHRRKATVACMPETPGSHYFDAVPSAPSRPRMVSLALPGVDLALTTDSGVFAADAIDPGTFELLRETPAPPTNGALLDLGCGYGPIALTLAARSPAAQVWAVDVNERARSLCQVNAVDAQLSNVTVCAPEEVPDDLRFAGIWSNPPIRVGKATLHEMLLFWLPRLADDAHAYLVVHKHLGADSLQRWLAEQDWPTRRHASRKGYRILDTARDATR